VLAVGLSVYQLLWLPLRPAWAFALAPVGAGVAIFMWNEWICFKAAHMWLVFRDKLPWRLTPFLQLSHDRGLFRKNGNTFEFPHLRLQEGFSNEVAAIELRRQ